MTGEEVVGRGGPVAGRKRPTFDEVWRPPLRLGASSRHENAILHSPHSLLSPQTSCTLVRSSQTAIELLTLGVIVQRCALNPDER